MAFMYMLDEDNPQQFRRDADGKAFIYARAGASATAQYGKIIYPYVNTTTEKCEMQATIPWDTAYTSCTDAYFPGAAFYVGFPMEAVPSDNFGWFQVAGKACINLITAATSTAGYLGYWHDATIKGAAGSTILLTRICHFGEWTQDHDTSNAAEIFLFGTPCFGIS